MSRDGYLSRNTVNTLKLDAESASSHNSSRDLQQEM